MMTFSRRQLLNWFGKASAGVAAICATKPVKAVVQSVRKTSAPQGYDPFAHKWLMAIDVEKCIGCGLCVEACKIENNVPQSAAYFRTWVERYTILKPKPGSGESYGETIVDSPNGGLNGFPPPTVPAEEILRSFFVPKLCNLCVESPCVQSCPVGATFDSPDGAVLIDSDYCIGCGFCIQSCPYGCRFMNPETQTAEKCSLCYHRITRGLQPACVEVCPTQSRIFGDLKNLPPTSPLKAFIDTKKTHVLKPHLGTEPRVLYSGIDKEVR